MRIKEQSDVCEELAIEWECQAIAELNRLLKDHGFVSRETREDILSSFFFHIAAEFDGAPVTGMEHKGREYRPRLVFVEEIEGDEVIHVSNTYDLHDYSHGDVACVLDETDQ